jgi:hypothetical protein
MRLDNPAFTTGELVWLENSRPESIVSFLRQSGDSVFLVIANVSNRNCEGTLTLPASFRRREETFKPEPPWSRRTKDAPDGVTLEGTAARFSLRGFDYSVSMLSK